MDRRKRRRFLSALQSGILEEIRSISNTAIASFTGDGRDLVRLVVGIEPVQSGSGDPSPDNVRPISGWTEAKVTRTGKNLVKVSCISSTANQVTYTNNGDGTVTVDGTASAFAGKALSRSDSDRLYLKAGTTYYLSGGGNGVNFYLYKTGVGVLKTDVGNGASYTPSVDEDDVTPYLSVSGGVSIDHLVVKPMLEVGSSASDWDVFNGNTYTIDLDGTRYGGTLDVTTGKLTVDRGMVDLGTVNWSKSSGTYGGFYATNQFYYRWASDTKMLCSRYKFDGVRSQSSYFGANGTLTCYFGNISPTFEIYIKDESLVDKTASEFKTEMSGVQLCYELITPIEVDLTPTQITTLSGVNNIWADTGDIILLEYMA